MGLFKLIDSFLSEEGQMWKIMTPVFAHSYFFKNFLILDVRIHYICGGKFDFYIIHYPPISFFFIFSLFNFSNMLY